MPNDGSDVLHGSLTLMLLQKLASLGSPYGYGLARRIEQTGGAGRRQSDSDRIAQFARLLEDRP